MEGLADAFVTFLAAVFVGLADVLVLTVFEHVLIAIPATFAALIMAKVGLNAGLADGLDE